MVYRWAESEHLMVPVIRQDIREFRCSASTRLTALGNEATIFWGAVVDGAVLTKARINIWLATECNSYVTGICDRVKRVMAFINAHFALRLKTIPAIQESIVSWIMVVGIGIQVTWRHVRRHGSVCRGTSINQCSSGLLSLLSIHGKACHDCEFWSCAHFS